MKVLIWTQYFHPENFPINDVALNLVNAGDSVTVLTGKPNYPEGKIFPGYQRCGIQREFHGEVEIIRVPVLERGRSKVRRFLNYVSFFFSALLLGVFCLRGRQFDGILAYGPSPLPNCIPAAIYGRVKRVKSCVWVQDLWPESILLSGISIPSGIFQMLRLQSWFLYRIFDLILVQSRGFIENVAKYPGVIKEKIRYVPNSYECRESFGDERLELLGEEIKGSFCVLFAGNLGEAQNLSIFVEAAEILRGNAEIRFFMIGDGSAREELLGEVSKRRLTNFSVPGAVPRSAVDSFLRTASVLTLSLVDISGVSQTIPSKLQGYLAAGRPILFAGTGEVRRVVEEAECGICVDSDCPVQFARAVESLFFSERDQLEEMGRKGKLYFEENFSPEIQIARLRDALGS